MKHVLIVSPRFPPVNAADMQRVRMSLPYFREFGWTPSVLAVTPTGDEVMDPVLELSLPSDVPIERAASFPAAWTRRVGIGDVALRALPWLYRAGARAMARGQADLVYFSTTAFLSMPLGRVWRARFGVPFVLDIQDPWLSDYYETHPEVAAPPKYGLAHRLHSVLEPWTMAKVDGLIAVSDAYIATLRTRYPWIPADTCATIPFAASETDYELLATHRQPNPLFAPGDGHINAVYVGRGGDDMAPALRMLFEALRDVRLSGSDAADRLRAFFVGTDYATDHRARKTVEPVATQVGLDHVVVEQPGRVPYFQALQVMSDADLLLLVGSDDPQYSASKAYPYLLARRPLVAVVHERSGLVPLLRDAATLLVTFGDGDRAAATAQLAAGLRTLLPNLPARVTLSERAAAACSARDMTRRQCEIFDRVMEKRRRRA